MAHSEAIVVPRGQACLEGGGGSHVVKHEGFALVEEVLVLKLLNKPVVNLV